MYPNQAFLKEIDISAEEFVYLTRMSSWAVCVNQFKPEKTTETVEDKQASSSSAIGGDDEHRIEADSELEELG